jgi:hypothetical protein
MSAAADKRWLLLFASIGCAVLAAILYLCGGM